jgi:hypothetical protein
VSIKRQNTDQTAHAPISLDADTVVIEILSRRFRSTSQKSSHHYGTRTKSQSLNNMTNVADATVSDYGDPKSTGKLGYRVDSSSLGSAHRHDLLGDANRTRSHTNAESVSTCGNEVGSLLAGDYVSGNNLELGEGCFNPMDHLFLEDGIALGRIEDYDIQAGFNQVSKTITVSWTGADGGSGIKLSAVWTFGCERV